MTPLCLPLLPFYYFILLNSPFTFLPSPSSIYPSLLLPTPFLLILPLLFSRLQVKVISCWKLLPKNRRNKVKSLKIWCLFFLMSFAFLYILNSLQSSLIVTYRSIHICQQNLNPSADPVPLNVEIHFNLLIFFILQLERKRRRCCFSAAPFFL